MGTGFRLLRTLLAAALALLLVAPASANQSIFIGYVESGEDNPELPSTAPASSDLELPLLPPEPVEEPAVPEPAPVETPEPEPVAEETSAPVTEEISTSMEEPVPADEASVSVETSVEVEAPQEIEVPPLPEADIELSVPSLPEVTPEAVETEAPAVETEVPVVEVPELEVPTGEAGVNPEAQSKLSYAESQLQGGHADEAVVVFEELVNGTGTDAETYSKAVSGYASALRAAGRREESEHWFQEALTYNPGDNDLRLAYAYTLAENEKLDRALYQLDILDKEASGNDAVTLARARAYAWSGQFEEALHSYNQVDDPKLADDAMLGSSYVLYWMGREDEARTMLGNVNLPGNSDVDELYALLGPEEHVAYGGYEGEKEDNASLSVTHRETEDSEDNTYSGNTAVINIPLGPKGSAIFISHEDFDLENNPTTVPPATPQTASGTNTRVGFSAPIDDGSKVTGYVGKVSIDNSGGQTIDHTDVGAALAGRFSCDWSYNVSYSDDLLYDSPELASNGISLQNTAVSTTFNIFDDDTTLELSYDTGNLSDDNSRQGYGFDLRRATCYDCRSELAYGLRGRWLGYDQDLDNGYFDPDKYQLAEVYLDWLDRSDNDLKWNAQLGLGMQTINDGDWRNTLRWALGITDQVSENFILRAGFGQSDLPTNAAQTSDDFNMQTWYVNGEWIF